MGSAGLRQQTAREAMSDDGPLEILGRQLPADADRPLPPILEGRQTAEVEALADQFFTGLEQLFETWVRRRSSSQTQRAYRRDIMAFVEWMGWRWPEDSIRFLSVSVSQVQAYRQFCTEHYAPKTVNRRVCSLSAWYKFLAAAAAEIRLPIQVPNPAHAQFIPRSRADAEKPTKELSVGAVRKLLALVEGDDPVAWRDRAMLYLFFFSGARIGAIAALQVDDFDYDAEGGSQLLLHEKGDLIRSIGFHQTGANVVFEYVRRCGLEDGPLLRRSAAPRSRDLGDEGLSVTSIRNRLKSLYVDLEGGEKFTPHSARATVATLLLDGGTDLAKVQELLGHRSIETTREYDKRRMGKRQSASHELPY